MSPVGRVAVADGECPPLDQECVNNFGVLMAFHASDDMSLHRVINRIRDPRRRRAALGLQPGGRAAKLNEHENSAGMRDNVWNTCKRDCSPPSTNASAGGRGAGTLRGAPRASKRVVIKHRGWNAEPRSRIFKGKCD